MQPSLLHLDDDPFFLDQVRDALIKSSPDLSRRLLGFSNLEKFRMALEQEPSVILLDIYLETENLDGRSLIRQLRQRYPCTMIIMCSDLHDIHTVKECMERGADDFLFKSHDDAQISRRLELADHEFSRRTLLHSKGVQTALPPNVAGQTARDLCQRIPRLLNSALSAIHIYGETGTGKEVIADIFEFYLGASVPFVRIHCGAIPESLLESELFGHVKGAFTGAQTSKQGLLEKADGGWVFLDEVATLSAAAQVALLRVLENHEIRPVGSNTVKAIQVRVLSATNENLEERVKGGSFRRDLWQRLCEVSLTLPPLRERLQEVDELVQFFCLTMRGGPYQLSTSASQILQQYSWTQGNVRELRNCLRAMTEHAYGGVISLSSLPPYIWQDINPAAPTPTSKEERFDQTLTIPFHGAAPYDYEELKTKLFLALLRHVFATEGHMTLRQLSKTLNVPRSTLSKKIQDLIKDRWVDAGQMKAMVNITTEAARK